MTEPSATEQTTIVQEVGGRCCVCEERCNPASQMCGVCMRLSVHVFSEGFVLE